jgi:hypothetical protein
MAVAKIAGPLSSLDYRIRFAIAHHRLIEVTYQRFTRLAEPHDYGSQRGVDRLLIYQLRGPARPGHSSTGWRLLDIPKIESLTVLDEQFPGSRGTQRQDHHNWDVVYARVD